ncbi:hypothetical protein M407DRAFT_241210 [Tulasnella calospora MUT 4182]|uniref:Uncharacterized protein n=1 Tax=Tulasnella calospora MUT 4182 TaxID=1051891 RepID=A0A0C3QW05_9AGAM|nr:hypothetical protein M407DRAFT_241210 [Tulasnella calospora MUT 4182]
MDISRAIVSFKAGRCLRKDGTNTVEPSPTKGLLTIVPSDDGLQHLLWLDRESGNSIGEDLILFPGDASFVPVTEAEGRVYVLKFTSSALRQFFWLQDADTSKDEENVQKVNDALKDEDEDETMDTSPTSEPQAVQQAPATSQPGLPPIQNAPPGTSPEEIARMRALLQSLGAAGGLGNVAGSSRGGGYGFVAPELTLTDILTPQTLQPLFENPDLLKAVFPTLPTDLPVPPSAATVKKIVESPPFQASVRQLDQALATGMLQGLMTGLGLPAEAGSGVAAFLKAISEQAKKNRTETGSGAEGDTMDTS